MNIRSILAAIAMASAGTFAALPSTMLFQGSITVDGASKSGTTALVVALYDAATSGAKVWEESFANVTLVNGGFAVQLGGTNALPAFDKPLYVQLTVDGKAAATRAPLTLAPYAAMAGAIPNVRSVGDNLHLDAHTISLTDTAQFRAANAKGSGNFSTTLGMTTNSAHALLGLTAADHTGDSVNYSDVSIENDGLSLYSTKGPLVGAKIFSSVHVEPQRVWMKSDSVVVDPSTILASPSINLNRSVYTTDNIPACGAAYEGMVAYRTSTSTGAGNFVGCVNAGQGTYAWKVLNN